MGKGENFEEFDDQFALSFEVKFDGPLAGEYGIVNFLGVLVLQALIKFLALERIFKARLRVSMSNLSLKFARLRDTQGGF
jgi:hypothetical protein